MRSKLSKSSGSTFVPTRYREVVLTVSNSESGLLRQSLVALFVLIILYLSGFLFAVRQVIKSEQRAIVKALLILALSFFLALFSLVTFLVLAFSTNPWAH